MWIWMQNIERIRHDMVLVFDLLFIFISFFFNLGDPFNALALFFLGALL